MGADRSNTPRSPRPIPPPLGHEVLIEALAGDGFFLPLTGPPTMAGDGVRASLTTLSLPIEPDGSTATALPAFTSHQLLKAAFGEVPSLCLRIEEIASHAGPETLLFIDCQSDWAFLGGVAALLDAANQSAEGET